VNKRHIRAFFVPEQNCDLRSAITDKPKLIITEMSYRPETETDAEKTNQKFNVIHIEIITTTS